MLVGIISRKAGGSRRNAISRGFNILAATMRSKPSNATMRSDYRTLCRQLGGRLGRGEHLVLFGPRGIGKSTLLAELEGRLRDGGMPCARAPATRCLNDITRALEQAYPTVETHAIARRTARARLWNAADLRRGVLLLDHLTEVSDAMVSFLRRLHGGVLGVLSVVDVEVERERRHMRPWRLGATRIRMPRAPNSALRELLRTRCTELGSPVPASETERRLLRAARGRPGWVIACAQRLAGVRYWQGRELFVTVLCTDTEIALRQAAFHRPE